MSKTNGFKNFMLLHFQKGIKMMKEEFSKFGEEQKIKWRMDSFVNQEHGDFERPFCFNTQEEIDRWIVSCDSDNGEGYSRADFELGKNNTGIFHGYLDNRVPKDGVLKDAGYCNITSPIQMVRVCFV